MAGENLGMKVDLSLGSNALMVDGRNCQWKRRNFNDHQWIVQQMCWWCRKVGHIHQGCMASQVEWDAYQEKKLVEHDTANAHAVINEPEVYAKAMLVEAIEGNEPEVNGWAMITMAVDIDEPEVYAETIIGETSFDLAHK